MGAWQGSVHVVFYAVTLGRDRAGGFGPAPPSTTNSGYISQ